MQKRIRVALGTASLILIAFGVSFADAEYLGAKKCKKCHIKQYKSWEKTTMAQSFEVLKAGERAEAKETAGLDPKTDYTADAECLPCHTTGYGKPGGFVSFEETPKLVGVQCESCHGPGGLYVADDKMSTKNKKYKIADLLPLGLVIPVAETCTSSCHNDRSPFMAAGDTFDFEVRKDEGTHEHKPLKYDHK